MKPAINLFLATSTSCNVRCWSCPAGRKEPEPGGVMKLEMAERILDKCMAESKVLMVQLYHYNEPAILPDMNKMVKACHDRGLPVFLSTNLVVWKNIPSIMAEEPDIFLVSVSGFTQEVYERSHKDGNIEAVKENMKKMAMIKMPGTTLQLSWHRYRYNEHELPLMQKYAESLGFQFVPYATSILPHDRAMKAWATGIKIEHEEELIVPLKEAKALCYDRKSWVCIMQDQVLAVNSHGDYMLCCHLASQANIKGSLFSTTIPQLLADRKVDPICKACKAVGGHVYGMQSYTRPKYSPLVLAEQLYRRLKLPGKIPFVSSWAMKSLYKTSRPQRT